MSDAATTHYGLRIPQKLETLFPDLWNAFQDTDDALYTLSGGVAAALADPGASGMISRTTLGVTVARTITGTANQIAVANGTGVSGNPTLSIPSNSQLSIAKITNLTANGFVKTSGSNGSLSVDTSTYLTGNQTVTLSGDASGSGATSIALTLATVNSNVGTFGSATQVAQITVNAKGLITAASNVTVTPAVGSITGLGTGVATALAVNTGSAGALVVNGGVLGTPSSGTLTNATGLPISTGVSGLGSGIATFLATPSSANLASAVTDETGSGPLVFGTGPTLTAAQIGSGTFATTGDIRGSNTFSLYVRNAANLGNLALITMSGDDMSLNDGGLGTNYVYTPKLRVSGWATLVSSTVGINAGGITSTNGDAYGGYFYGSDNTASGATGDLFGVYASGKAGATAGTSVRYVYGVLGYGLAHDTTSVKRVYGLYGLVGVDQTTITERIVGVRSLVSPANVNSIPLAIAFKGGFTISVGTVTDVRGLDLSEWTASSTVTTSYGIYMDSSIDVGTTKYAIYSTSLSNSVLQGGLTIGVAGTTLGLLKLTGNTSGTVTINTAAAAGTWTLTLPTTGGTSGYVLSTNGSGVTSWVAASGGGGDALTANPLSQFAATTSAQLRGVLSDENGTGVALFDSATSPTFLTGATISGSAPSLTFTDTTASAKSLKIAIDANLADFIEAAGASGSLLTLDLANNRIGVGTNAPGYLAEFRKDQNAATELAIRNTTGGTAAQSRFFVGSNTYAFYLGQYSSSTNAYGALLANYAYFYGSVGFLMMVDGSGPIDFATGGNALKMRLTEVGNLKIGTTATRGTTEGTNQLVIANGTAPAGTLTNAASFFVAAGEMKVMDSGGTATLLSQHSSDAPDSLYDANEKQPANVGMETNVFAGMVRFTNYTRMLRLQQMVFNGETLPPGKKRQIVHEETFDQYNKRLGLTKGDAKFLEAVDWDQDQAQQAKMNAAELLEWERRKDSTELSPSGKVVKFSHHHARPVPHVKKPKPQWLGN